MLFAIHKFLGTHLPPRTRPLEFVLPAISERVQASQSLGLELDNDSQEGEEDPNHYFRVLKARIIHVNRCGLSARQRLGLTQKTISDFYPRALAKVVEMGRAGGGLPEAEDRKKILNHIIDITQILIVSCQILFQNYYDASNYSFARSRTRFQKCATLIFELMLFKQQAKGLRYQMLSDQDWRIINTIFYVLSIHDHIDAPRPLLRDESNKDRSKTFSELFALLHLFARFDPMRWPIHLQWIIRSYVESVPGAATVLISGAQASISRDHLVCYGYGNQPANSRQFKPEADDAIVMNCSTLFGAIKKDCLALVGAAKSNDLTKIPERFSRFDEKDRLVISEQLLNGLVDRDADQQTDGGTEVKDLRIFVGFFDVFALLYHRQSEFANEERLADVLAKRSAVMAEDHHSNHKSLWTLVFKNDTVMRLSTQESSFTTPMAIGSLLAYGMGDDVNRPCIAVVSRIHRQPGKVVEVDVSKIADYAEAVLFNMNSADTNQGKRAILAYNPKMVQKWGLIVRLLDVIYGLDDFSIYRNKRPHHTNLENIRMATTDFSLFSTTFESAAGLGFSKEPSYASE